ncbi:hypothetical protein IWZ01DRAFT_74229 [Phyllosticta capitalensis]
MIESHFASFVCLERLWPAVLCCVWLPDEKMYDAANHHLLSPSSQRSSQPMCTLLCFAFRIDCDHSVFSRISTPPTAPSMLSMLRQRCRPLQPPTTHGIPPLPHPTVCVNALLPRPSPSSFTPPPPPPSSPPPQCESASQTPLPPRRPPPRLQRLHHRAHHRSCRRHCFQCWRCRCRERCGCCWRDWKDWKEGTWWTTWLLR